MGQAIVEEAMRVVDPEVDRQDGGVAVGNTGSDELGAKTEENSHTHPTSRRKNRKEAQEMSILYGIRYAGWSGVTPQVWMIWRLVQVMSEVYVMTRAVASQRRKTGNMQQKKLAGVKVTKWTWKR